MNGAERETAVSGEESADPGSTIIIGKHAYLTAGVVADHRVGEQFGDQAQITAVVEFVLVAFENLARGGCC